MKLLSAAKLLVDVPDTNYRSGDEVVILDKARKVDGHQGWWIEKVGEPDVTAVSESDLEPIVA